MDATMTQAAAPQQVSITMPFSGGVFLCPNGYWSFALTLPEITAFGSFFDSAFAAEDELLRQYPEGVEPFYFSDCTPSPRRAIRSIVLSALADFCPYLGKFLALFLAYLAAHYISSIFIDNRGVIDLIILFAAVLVFIDAVISLFRESDK